MNILLQFQLPLVVFNYRVSSQASLVSSCLARVLHGIRGARRRVTYFGIHPTLTLRALE